MSQRVIVLLKVLAHIASLAPFAWLAWHLYLSATSNPNALGPNPTQTVTFFTGFATLRLLIITLAITPARRLIPGTGWLIRFRRMLGLYAFFYGCLHLITYVWLYAGLSWPVIVNDVGHRPYIWAGLTAWGLMVPLAATSTTWAIRTMGGKNWNRLHKLIYISAIAGVVHYWWIVKPGVYTPLTLTVILGVLLAMRPLLAWWKNRPSKPAAAAA